MGCMGVIVRVRMMCIVLNGYEDRGRVVASRVGVSSMWARILGA